MFSGAITMSRRIVFVFSCLLFLSATLLFGARRTSPYDARWNEKRIADITNEVLNQVSIQEKEYVEKLEERNSNKGNYGSSYGDPYGGPGMSSPNSPANEEIPPFKLDVERIKKEITKKFGGDQMDSIGKNPRVDVGTKQDLYEAAVKIVDNRSEFKDVDINALYEQEIKDAEEKYPLYKQGETVEITFAYGNEPRRTYRGTFRLEGPFKIWIGRTMLNKNDLPDLIRPRFYTDLNREARAREIDKHLLVNKFKIAREEAIAAEAKELLKKQFQKNLPRGWVYVNDTWKMGAEMVDDILEYRREDLKIRSMPRPVGGPSYVVPGRSN